MPPRHLSVQRRARRLVVAALAAGLVAALPLAAPAVAAEKPTKVQLPNGWLPEDIANGRGSTFFVGSITTGGIFRGDYRTGTGRVLVPSAPGLTAGLFTELRSSGKDRLWASNGATGQARVYDPGTGALLATYQLTPATSGGFVSDVLVTKTAAYYTDAALPQLYVLPLGKHGELPKPSAIRTVPLSGVTYQADPFNFNLDGLAMVDGTLVSVQTNTGALFAIDPRTGATRRVPVTDAAGAPASLSSAATASSRGGPGSTSRATSRSGSRSSTSVTARARPGSCRTPATRGSTCPAPSRCSTVTSGRSTPASRPRPGRT